MGSQQVSRVMTGMAGGGHEHTPRLEPSGGGFTRTHHPSLDRQQRAGTWPPPASVQVASGRRSRPPERPRPASAAPPHRRRMAGSAGRGADARLAAVSSRSPASEGLLGTRVPIFHVAATAACLKARGSGQSGGG